MNSDSRLDDYGERERVGMNDLRLNRLGVLSIDSYVENVESVWADIHPRRTVFDCALHVLDHASRLGEAVRKDDASDVLKETAQTTNWLFGFVGRLNASPKVFDWETVFDIPTSFSRMIWDKFPRLCPHCFERKFMVSNGSEAGRDIAADIHGKCMYCLVQYPAVERRSELETEEDREEYKSRKRAAEKLRREVAAGTVSNRPRTLKKMEEMFHELYRSNVAVLTIESIGFHLLEEAGEMARAVIDLYTPTNDNDDSLIQRQLDLCDETAEVFAWICSLTLKVQEQARSFDKYREKLVVDVVPGAGRGRRLADLASLEQILWIEYKEKDGDRYRCPYCRRVPCECRVTFGWESRPTSV